MSDQPTVAAPYDVLFEPVRIGPVTARNRFYQVPHCNGMGYRDPSAQAAMRKIKAEGGWSVVCTEQVEIHATSDIAPFIESADLGRPGPARTEADRRCHPRGRWPRRHRVSRTTA
ncbi:hypothetical protein [Nocardioides convexus]|uniref:oxidoreductase n=1 Tax=Nocardioides convexus TaxID=2712224 RepID=UPI0024185391|nr:hypothetical protein [Nocardioides convexus]